MVYTKICERCRVNPLTAGTEHIRFFHFYYHIKYYLLKMKCDMN